MAFTILGLDHVLLRIENKETMLDFYLNVLGCTQERQLDNLGLIQLRAGASLIDLVPTTSPLGQNGRGVPLQQHANLDHLCLRIEPFDEAALSAHLHACGLAPLGEAQVNFGAEGMGLSLYFADPDGNVIELKGPSTQ